MPVEWKCAIRGPAAPTTRPDPAHPITPDLCVRSRDTDVASVTASDPARCRASPELSVSGSPVSNCAPCQCAPTGEIGTVGTGTGPSASSQTLVPARVAPGRREMYFLRAGKGMAMGRLQAKGRAFFLREFIIRRLLIFYPADKSGR